MSYSTKIKLLTIIGARPQIIKAAALSRIIKDSFSDDFKEIILHTGQHYDKNMSEIFFKELGIPKENINLNVGSNSHADQTAQMLSGIEKAILNNNPNYVIVYGDTNSTLAGAIAASKLNVPIIHIEAGLRSFDKTMPEELNRIVTDHCSTYLFSPTQTGLENLKNEGFKDSPPPYTFNQPGIFNVGDIMYDNTLFFKELAHKNSNILEKLNVASNAYILATVHRDSNTEDSNNLKNIFNSLIQITEETKLPIVIPLHPRTFQKLNTNYEQDWVHLVQEKLNIIEPVSFFDMIQLESHSKIIITDSGGVQKEAYFLKKPCVILRNTSEWVELIENGNAQLVGAHKDKILEATYYFLNHTNFSYPKFYGDGNAAKNILTLIKENHI